MPGIVVFKRRWSVGSDDFVVPGIFLLLLHTVWLVVLSVILSIVDFGQWSQCILDLHEHVIGYIVILTGCIVVEGFISWVSMRGTILYTAPRASMQYLLYVRLGILLVELAWLIVGVVWISRHYNTCPLGLAKKAVLGIIICNWCVLLSVMVTVWCTFDAAGRTWVKMKKYQRSLREGKAKFRYRRSGNSHRNWRHRKAVREYQDSWNKRCRLLFCCMGRSDRNRNSFAEIAKLLSEFFRDLDVVPSDVVAGLVLLRKFQGLERQAIVKQKKNEIYQFLSGAPISSDTRFLDITHPLVAQEVRNITHYLHYALAIYGWPMYMIVHSGTGCCRLCPYLRCCCLVSRPKVQKEKMTLLDDNCCRCNYAALQKLCKSHNMEVVFATYHVEVGETPFFVALDHEKRTVVVSIRGTLSLQDVLTDLNAEGEHLPLEQVRDDWIGHKGMVQVAEYIRKKLVDEGLLTQAFNFSPDRGSQSYDLVLVGHSLGAGAAAILAILLRQYYPNLMCYSYSPPGGLLSLPAVEYTKSFITSVVLGKDVVPRIGLHQLEALRTDLINAIKRSRDPKWKVIFSGVLCCCPEANADFDHDDLCELTDKADARDATSHPSDSSIALTVHQPLYPPGRIIHIVRNHPHDQEHESKLKKLMKKTEPVYQAVLVDNRSLDEVLISPVMIQDHMPDRVLEALEKLLVNTGPAKPQRNLNEIERRQLLSPSVDTPDSNADRTPPHRLVLETSFTDLQPDALTTPETILHLDRIASLKHPTVTWDPKSPYLNVPTVDPSKKLDLLQDDWLGMAPIASPETLSDVSSISSKGSHQRLSNGGTRLSWGGVPVMEPIAQSPALHRPYTFSSPSEPPLDCLGGHQVLTEVSVEPMPFERACDPSRLSLNLQAVESKFSGTISSEVDSTYASTSTERASDRTCTPKEIKRVTFEEDGQEESADSVYNSGESFVPTYPEFCSQQEYGNHLYMYPHHHCEHSPPNTMEHSMSEAYLSSLARRLWDSPEIRRTCEEQDMQCLKDTSQVHDDIVLNSSPRRRFSLDDGKVLVTVVQRLEEGQMEEINPPPTESSL